jgi:hypothetical protein
MPNWFLRKVEKHLLEETDFSTNETEAIGHASKKKRT